MARAMTDATTLLRDAIKAVLDRAVAPMTSIQIAEVPSVFELGLGSTAVSQELSGMYNATKKAWPLKRLRAGAGRSKWEYFNPRVVKLEPTPKAAPALPPVNAVNPPLEPAFAFNPVEFNPVEFDPVESQVELPVAVPAGVKSITLTIGGVSIKIDLA